MAEETDVAGVTAWFETLAGHVREVDFIGARPIFAPDMVAFGTFTDFMTGRDAAEQQQWRNVWQQVPVTANTAYQLTGWVRTSANSDNAFFGARTTSNVV